MNVYEALVEVSKAGVHFRGGTQITSKVRKASVKQLDYLVDASTLARKLGASPYDITEAIAGRIPEYLKEGSDVDA
jgi:hypothetical protein